MRIITAIFLGVLAFDAVVLTFLELAARGRERRRQLDAEVLDDYLRQLWEERVMSDECFASEMRQMMGDNTL